MELTGNTFYFPWEVSLMEWLQGTLPAVVIRVISVFSMPAEELLLIVLIGYLYWCRDKDLGRHVALTAIAALVLNPMIKNIAARRRPYLDHGKIRILRPVDSSADVNDIAAQGFSFPSGHSTNAVSVYGSLAVSAKNRWITALAVAVPILVGLSRVTVGAHYPTDVLGGWLLGALICLLITALEKRIRDDRLLYGLLLLIMLPGFFYCKSADFFSSAGLFIGFAAADLTEKRFVRFSNTRSVLQSVLRILVGGGLYFVLNTLFKLPFSHEFLNSGTLPALLVRCARYAVIMFVLFSLYPLLFRHFPGAGKD